ncbi:MAG TPA: spondin domain-containing protein [Chloroflexota bacterium]|nr:spondin domain-containing protein [Chloroflexota bacterium]
MRISSPKTRRSGTAARSIAGALLVGLGATVAGSATAAGAQSPGGELYRVTLQNVAAQPWAPPVVATHRDGTHVFQVGAMASDEIATVAQQGNPAPLHTLLSGMPQVTQAINVGHPIPGRGTQRTVDGMTFGDTEVVEIRARPGDRLSVAGMLACTNDGFFGLDSVVIPTTGSATYMANAYDAGREDNTQRSEDLGDPCSVLGAAALRGDPNGNASPLTGARQPIQLHAGITATGDLTASAHGWQGAVGRITVARVAGASALPSTGGGPSGAALRVVAGLAVAAAGAGLALTRRRA